MCLQALPNTEVKVFDLHAPVKVPWNDFAAAKQILDAHENDNSSRLVSTGMLEYLLSVLLFIVNEIPQQLKCETDQESLCRPPLSR